MKKLTYKNWFSAFAGITILLVLLTSTKCTAQYDPPSGYTTNYRLRMWDEGDRPGADSVNQNLIDIDYIIKNYLVHSTGNEIITGQKRFTNKIEIGTSGSTLSTDSAAKIFARTWFMKEAPFTSYAPSDNSQLTNKYYVDNAITTASSNYVTLTGSQEIAGAKTFTSGTFTVGDDASGTITLQMYATDNAQISFNNSTFITWDAATMTIAGTVDASGYKQSGVTKYLTSAYGEKEPSSIYVSSTDGGTTDLQLNMVPVTINGTTYKILIKE